MMELSFQIMIYLMLEVQSTEHTDNCKQLHAWVNTGSQQDALGILSEELSLQGWSITHLIEATTTCEADYFPPCTSLDAFREASQGLIATRFI